jgi:hypothetical protein
MNSMDRNGTPLSNNRRYQFNIDSLSSNNECFGNTLPGDRNFVLSNNDITLNPGEVRKFSVGLVAAPSAGGCPYFNRIGLLNIADTALKYYWNL